MLGFHRAKFGLSRAIRSRVMLRHGTDRQTDGQTDTAAHFIMPPSLRGGGIINGAKKLKICTIFRAKSQTITAVIL